MCTNRAVSFSFPTFPCTNPSIKNARNIVLLIGDSIVNDKSLKATKLFIWLNKELLERSNDLESYFGSKKMFLDTRLWIVWLKWLLCCPVRNILFGSVRRSVMVGCPNRKKCLKSPSQSCSPLWRWLQWSTSDIYGSHFNDNHNSSCTSQQVCISLCFSEIFIIVRWRRQLFLWLRVISAFSLSSIHISRVRYQSFSFQQAPHVPTLCRQAEFSPSFL